jgi:hypothetical protein
MTLQPHDQAHFEPEGFRPKSTGETAHNADAALREAVEAALLAFDTCKGCREGWPVDKWDWHGKTKRTSVSNRFACKWTSEQRAALAALRSPATGD